MAVPRSVVDRGGQTRPGGGGGRLGMGSGDFTGGGTLEVIVEANETVDEAGSQDEVESEDDVEAESLPQDSRLDSVSVEPVEPIDMVLPICLFIPIIGFVSTGNNSFW